VGGCLHGVPFTWGSGSAPIGSLSREPVKRFNVKWSHT
jgi:hypothetical protein